MPVLRLDAIQTLCFEALTRAGASFDQASAVALEVMDAEAEGIRNVGLGYIHLYLKHLKCGKILGDAVPKIVRTSEASTVIDAGFGFCHTAYLLGEDRLIATAKAQGIGIFDHPSIILRGRSGLVRSTTRPAGPRQFSVREFVQGGWRRTAGKVPFFGTNPFAFGSPRHQCEPVVFDMATASTCPR